MRLRNFSRTCRSAVLASMLSALILLATATGIAKNGRDFAGFYSVSDPNQAHDGQASEVQVMLTLQLFNYTGADLKQATVTVSEAHPGMKVLGTYAPVPLWRNGTDAVMNIHIAVPRDEYLRWSARRPPNVEIIYSDDQGKQWQRSAQISRRPTIPLEGSNLVTE